MFFVSFWVINEGIWESCVRIMRRFKVVSWLCGGQAVNSSKTCMSKFLVVFYSSLPCDMMAGIVDILLRGIFERPIFTWSRVDYIQTKVFHPENPETMLVMKDLENVYKRVKGPMTFTRRNTIFVDSNVF
jgi:hypothetical protein